jgi:predicted  nucleic acid-binding Zn-ribbon protein
MQDKNPNNNKELQANKSSGGEQKPISLRVDSETLDAFDSVFENRSEAIRSFIESVAHGGESEAELEAELADVEDQLESVEGRIDDLESELEQARDEQSNLEQRRRVLRSQLEEVEEQKSEIESDIEDAAEFWRLNGTEPTSEIHNIAAQSDMSVEEVREEVRIEAGVGQ